MTPDDNPAVLHDLNAEADQLAIDMLQLTRKLQTNVIVDITPSGKIKRNGPCPCGSNLKFKKCCLCRTRSGGDLQRISKSEVNNHRIRRT